MPIFITSKIWTNGGYSYLTELKILLEKEKLLVTSNFSFSHNVFKSRLLLMRQNEYLWSKRLRVNQSTLLENISMFYLLPQHKFLDRSHWLLPHITVIKTMDNGQQSARMESRWSDCHQSMNIGQAGDQTSNLLFSDPQCYQMSYTVNFNKFACRHYLVGYFRLFIVSTGSPSDWRPQKTVSGYRG